jgi:multimeric flavodoxin WrbA
MAKKIVILCGSPHSEGHTSALAGWVAAGARRAGANVRVVDVTRLKYKADGCTGCWGCQKSKAYRCVVRDQATPILASLPKHDVVAFATPLYWFGPTAQMKRFTDRMFSLCKIVETDFRHAFRPKTTFALIAPAAGPVKDNLDMLLPPFRAMAKGLGGKLKALLAPNVYEADKASLRRKAETFGKALTRG